MGPLTLLPYYIAWHYGRALGGVRDITLNYMWFFWHFFSIGLLARTLVEPWQRLHEEKPNRFDVEDIFSRLMVNTVMRLVGVIVRGTFIIIGLIAVVSTLALGLFVFISWLLLPVLILFFLIFGLFLIIKPS